MKTKITKIVPVLLAAAMCGSLFAGCVTNNNNNNNNPPPAHTTHTWSATYVSDGESGHHRTSTCTEHDPINDTTVPHEYDNDQDATCNKCDYVREIKGEDKKFEGKIYLVGDSTVCSFNDPYYMPRYGYGTQLAQYLNVTSDQVVNLALSGRSSKSFLTEDNYTTLTTSISEGDYLIISFGHNDEKSDDAARFTSPVGDKDTAGSFQNSLYANYIKIAAEKGATPVLCTPITRYDASGAYTGAKVHVTADGDYVQAIKDLGAATDTTVVDLTALTVEEYSKDNAAAADFHAYTTYDETSGVKTPAGRDDTHLNKYGAKMVAYLFSNALKSTSCELKNFVKADITAPTKDNDYASAIDTSYVKPDYSPFDPSSHEANELGEGWYKTAMGDIGGADKIPSYKIEKDGAKFTVGCEVANGKIAGASDGFAAAFMQISKNDNFRASVKATVKASANANNQSAFGMMLRDDILVDTADKTVASNYVAGGLYSTKANVFGRFNTAQTKNAVCTTAAAVDLSYDITIERVGQIVTVTVAGIEPVVFQESAMDLFARDNDYMYLCLFANRGIVAEFTNFTYEKTGDSQGA